MTTRKKLRVFLILYLIFSLTISAYGFGYGLSHGKQIKQISQGVNKHGTVKEDPAFGIQIVLSPLMWIFSLFIILLYLVSWIALFLFWRKAPILFSVYVALSYVAFPALSGWWNSLSPLLEKFTSISEPSLLMKPLNAILLLLCGIILAIIYSKEGKSLYMRNETIKIKPCPWSRPVFAIKSFATARRPEDSGFT
jgi:hypothetical protein